MIKKWTDTIRNRLRVRAYTFGVRLVAWGLGPLRNDGLINLVHGEGGIVDSSTRALNEGEELLSHHPTGTMYESIHCIHIRQIKAAPELIRGNIGYCRVPPVFINDAPKLIGMGPAERVSALSGVGAATIRLVESGGKSDKALLREIRGMVYRVTGTDQWYQRDPNKAPPVH